MSIAVVLANGNLENAEVIRNRIEQLPGIRVFAADGGSRHAQVLGVTIEQVIGDLDSLDEPKLKALSEAGTSFKTHLAVKDETDLELALLHIRALGYSRIILVGALGGRLDMTIANLQLLTHPELADLKLEIWNGTQTAWVLRPPEAELPGNVGDIISLIPIDGPAGGIRTRNLLYPLHDESLFPGPGRGISNAITKHPAHVGLRSGLLLVVHTPREG